MSGCFEVSVAPTLKVYSGRNCSKYPGCCIPPRQRGLVSSYVEKNDDHCPRLILLASPLALANPAKDLIPDSHIFRVENV